MNKLILHYSEPLWTLPLSVINDIILLVLLPVLAVVPFMITVYVCIVWTHHPDLSLADILRDTFKEITTVHVTPPGRMKKVSGRKKMPTCGKKMQTGRLRNHRGSSVPMSVKEFEPGDGSQTKTEAAPKTTELQGSASDRVQGTSSESVQNTETDIRRKVQEE